MNYYLQRVTADDRDYLFSSIQKGKNRSGGVYGTQNNSPAPRQYSTQTSTMKGYDTAVQDPNSGQKYQMSQKDPIIVRGG